MSNSEKPTPSAEADAYSYKVVVIDGLQNRIRDLAEPDGSNDVWTSRKDSLEEVKAEHSDLVWIISQAFIAGRNSVV